ncbi:MAG: PEP-CTERM sorting domain-containing protein [Chthoniobacteraceae bacterium]
MITPPPSNDLGFLTIPLDFGEEIGPLLAANYGPLAGFYSDDAFSGGGLLAGTDGFGGHYFGLFAFIRAYAGLRFEIEGKQHYAWLDLHNALIGGGGVGFKVHGWAYETEPDKPIAAGAVPEPHTAILLFAGVASVLVRRRRLPIPENS